MSTTQIRKLLYEYIRFADERKVKALYTIVEDEIGTNHDHWTEALSKELKKRSRNAKSMKLSTRRSVSTKVKALLAK